MNKTPVLDWRNVQDFSQGKQVIEVSSVVVDYLLNINNLFQEEDLRSALKNERSNIEEGSNGKLGNHEYYKRFQGNYDSCILVNPEFKLRGNTLGIDTKAGSYYFYHACNSLRNGFLYNKSFVGQNFDYKPLSAGVIMYSDSSKSFYLFRRPENSQENPGEIDLLGGTMNIKDSLKPADFVASRIRSKAGLIMDSSNLKLLGIQEFTKRGFYNIVFLYQLNNKEESSLQGKKLISKIGQNDFQNVISQQNNPGGASLSLALKSIS